MICVFNVGNENYTGNGNAVLMPSVCTVTEDAGGSYELRMIHPVDVGGKWSHLQPGALVRVPVPVATIQGGAAGLDADVYKTKVATDLQEQPQDAWEAITYAAWNSQTAYGNAYNVGSRVTYSGNNYQCINGIP